MKHSAGFNANKHCTKLKTDSIDLRIPTWYITKLFYKREVPGTGNEINKPCLMQILDLTNWHKEKNTLGVWKLIGQGFNLLRTASWIKKKKKEEAIPGTNHLNLLGWLVSSFLRVYYVSEGKRIKIIMPVFG